MAFLRELVIKTLVKLHIKKDLISKGTLLQIEVSQMTWFLERNLQTQMDILKQTTIMMELFINNIKIEVEAILHLTKIDKRM